MLLITAVAAVFLTAVGAFETSALGLQARAAYWLTVMLGGGLIAAAWLELFAHRGWLEGNAWVQGAAISLLISIPETVLVWAVGHVAFGAPAGLGQLLWTFPPVLLISAAVTALNFMAAQEPPTTHAPLAPEPGTPAPPPVRFLERLPPKLRGAALHAVEAEDHYLRLHTSQGSDLILLRLADAIVELEGIEGAQTHRSWWVARAAVEGARRSDGRATLLLPGGVEAPVSRTYAKALREAGWF